MVPGRVATSSHIGVQPAFSPVIYQPIVNSRNNIGIKGLGSGKRYLFISISVISLIWANHTKRIISFSSPANKNSSPWCSPPCMSSTGSWPCPPSTGLLLWISWLGGRSVNTAGDVMKGTRKQNVAALKHKEYKEWTILCRIVGPPSEWA